MLEKEIHLRPKVGVLTLPLHNNFGGNLQAYALMKILLDGGFDAHFIQRSKPDYPVWKYLFSIPKGILTTVATRTVAPVFIRIKNQLEYKHISVNSRAFIESHINPRTTVCKNTDALKKIVLDNKFDCVVVGSDQIWRPSYAPNIYDYFLGFLPPESGVKKVSYGASFGTDSWLFSEEQTERCKYYLSLFSRVSVRERSAVLMCEDKFGVSPKHVLDPTMLLDLKYYRLLVDNSDGVKRGGGVSYILDDSRDISDIRQYISDKKISIRPLNSKTEVLGAPLSDRVAPPVSNWLAGIYHSDFLVTDSFHGCVFAILFNKPFIVCGNKRRGLSRFDSLLKDFSLSERLITNVSEVDAVFEANIDWASVNKRLNSLKSESKNYLINSIRGSDD